MSSRNTSQDCETQGNIQDHRSTMQPNIFTNNRSIRSVLQPALVDMLLTQDFDWHITANLNRTTTHANGRSKLRDWSKYVDRRLHGRCFYRKPTDQRLFFVAIPEIGIGTGYLHYHLLAKLPHGNEDRFAQIAKDTWANFNPTGSMFIQRIVVTPEDMLKVVRYDTKNVWMNDGYEQIILSTEFNCSTQQRSVASS